jgi:hypothetical protein
MVQNSKAVNWLLMKQSRVNSSSEILLSEVIVRCSYASGLEKAINNNLSPEFVA